MKLKRATEQDIDHWLRMRKCLWPDSSATHRQDIAEYLSGQSRDIRECFLVEESCSPLGFIELNIRNYAEGSRHARVPYVEGWYVDEAFRGRGFGALLMERAEAWARENGFSEIASDAELDNSASIAAHRKLGFEETDRVVCFLKKLT